MHHITLTVLLWFVHNVSSSQIADFGMSRDITDETYYISHGGKIPVRWTAPEASVSCDNLSCRMLGNAILLSSNLSAAYTCKFYWQVGWYLIYETLGNVHSKYLVTKSIVLIPINILCYRLFITRSTLQPVMSGAMVVLCMRYGVWGINHLRLSQTIK